MRVSERQIAKACVGLLHEGKLSPSEVSHAMLGYLSKKHWMRRSRNILTEIRKTLNEEAQIVPVSVTSIRRLSDLEKNGIEKLIGQFFPDQKIQSIWKVDPTLLGGITIETDNMRYDTTLSSRLRKLSHSYSLSNL